MENRNKTGEASSALILLLVVIVLVIGVYILFFKDKDKPNSNNNSNVPVQEVEKNNNVKRISLTKKVTGTTGDLYLDRDGKVYFVLSSMGFGSLSTLNQEFYVEKNDIYSNDTINSIMLTLSGVTIINYDASLFILTTNDGKTYFINENDIINNNRILINEQNNSAVPVNPGNGQVKNYPGGSTGTGTGDSSYAGGKTSNPNGTYPGGSIGTGDNNGGTGSSSAGKKSNAGTMDESSHTKTYPGGSTGTGTGDSSYAGGKTSNPSGTYPGGSIVTGDNNGGTSSSSSSKESKAGTNVDGERTKTGDVQNH